MSNYPDDLDYHCGGNLGICNKKEKSYTIQCDGCNVEFNSAENYYYCKECYNNYCYDCYNNINHECIDIIVLDFVSDNIVNINR